MADMDEGAWAPTEDVPEPSYGRIAQPDPVTADINSGGAESDPFAYTKGSLLTPWTGKFEYNGPKAPAGGYYSGTAGYSPLAPLQFSDFAHSVTQPSAFSGTGQFTPSQKAFQSPGDFQSTLAQFNGPSYATPGAFVPPTVTEDPGYQFRLQQGLQALENSAAAKGILRTGGTYKGLEDYAQDAASQEYAAAYARRFGEYQTQAELGMAAYDRQYQESRDEYTLGYEREASEYDRSYTNALQRYQMGFQNEFNTSQANFTNALNAWRSNADVNLEGQTLGYNVASGVWDRNYGKAQNAYQIAVQQAEAAAQIASAEAAAAAGASQWASSTDYNRALGEYKTGYDEFQTNQTNQFNRLYAMDQLGLAAAGAFAGVGSNYAGNVGNIGMAGANANAAGQVGSANAWNSAFGTIANTTGQIAMWGAPPPAAKTT